MRTRAGLLAAAAARLRAQGGLVVAAADGPSDPGALQGSWADALGVGDLDGDGAEDVGILDIALPDGSLTLRAVRGPDASQLWSHPMASAGLLLTRRDLTGDGADDLIRFAIPRFEVLEEDCPPEQWECDDYHAVFEWEVSVLSGRDLRPAWTRSWSGRVTEEYRDEQDLAARRITYRFEVRNGWILPFDMGAGSRIAVLTDAWDLDDRWDYTDATVPVVEPDTFSASVRTTDRLTVHDGATGAALASAVHGPAAGYTQVDPGTDLDHDGHAEVLLLTSVQPEIAQACTDLVIKRECTGTTSSPDHRLDLLDGRTLAQRWSRPSGGAHGTAGMLDADVTGDGVPDLAHRWFTAPQGGSPARAGTDVLSGADGSLVWQLDSYAALTGVGDVDGDGRDDLVHTATVHSGDTATITLHRRDGGTGKVLFSTSHHLGGGGATEAGYVYAADDQDADGRPDLVFGRVTYRVEQNSSGASVLVPDRSTAQVESARTGGAVWAATGPGARTLLPLGDLDGDGTEDFDWSTVRAVDGVTVLELDVRRGRSGARLWSRSLESPFGYVAAVGDIDLDGRADLAVVHDEDQGTTWLSHVLGVAGRDGTQRWALRSQP